jgi:riboflavin transporter FmnP
MGFRKSIVIANVVVFSGLAIILSYIKAETPFPLLPYLKFDFAEIPVVILLLLVGPIPALIAEVIHFISLVFTHGWVLGPLMKLLAVIPMILGFWLGIVVYKKVRGSKRYNSTTGFILGNIIGIIARVIVCTITNIVVLLIVAPEYLTYAEYTLQSVGFATASTFDVLLLTLILTGVFNTLHVPISSIVSVIVVRGAVIRIPVIGERAWMLMKPSKT